MPHPGGRPQMLKVTFLKEPASIKGVQFTNGGIWFESLELGSKIQREAAGTGPAAIPQDKRFLNGFPLMFVPFSQVEWLAADQSFLTDRTSQ